MGGIANLRDVTIVSSKWSIASLTCMHFLIPKSFLSHIKVMWGKLINKTSLLLLLNLFAWVHTCHHLMYLFWFVNNFYQEAPLKLTEKEETTSLQTEFVEKTFFLARLSPWYRAQWNRRIESWEQPQHRPRQRLDHHWQGVPGSWTILGLGFFNVKFPFAVD